MVLELRTFTAPGLATPGTGGFGGCAVVFLHSTSLGNLSKAQQYNTATLLSSCIVGPPKKHVWRSMTGPSYGSILSVLQSAAIVHANIGQVGHDRSDQLLSSKWCGVDAGAWVASTFRLRPNFVSLSRLIPPQGTSWPCLQVVHCSFEHHRLCINHHESPECCCQHHNPTKPALGPLQVLLCADKGQGGKHAAESALESSNSSSTPQHRCSRIGSSAVALPRAPSLRPHRH